MTKLWNIAETALNSKLKINGLFKMKLVGLSLSEILASYDLHY